MKNLFVLLSTFLFGHGSIFLAQTFLIQSGYTDRVADFGLAYSFFVFSIFLIETSTIQVLARMCIQNDKKLDAVSHSFLYVIGFRVIVATIYIVSIRYIFSNLDSQFSEAFLVSVIGSIILICIHPSGMLDGIGRVGVNGVILAGQNITISVCLLITRDAAAVEAARVIGYSVSLYYLLVMVIVHFYLVSLGLRYPIADLKREEFFEVFYELLRMIFAVGPGQILQRFQMVLGTVYLATEVMAAYVYVRQGLSFISQVLGFIRRVEFPDVVSSVKDLRGTGLAIKCLAVQKYSIVAAILIFALVECFLVSPVSDFFPEFDAVFSILLVASFLILSEAMSSSLMFGFIAKGLTGAAAKIRIFIVVSVAMAAYLLTPLFGVLGLLLPEVFGQVLIFIFGVLYLKRTGTRCENV